MKVQPIFAINGSRYLDVEDDQQLNDSTKNLAISGPTNQRFNRYQITTSCPIMQHPFLAGAIAVYMLALLYYVRKAAN